MARKQIGETQEYNPKWDLGIVADGWPRAVGDKVSRGKRLQPCRICHGSHFYGETPIACLDAIGRELTITEDDTCGS